MVQNKKKLNKNRHSIIHFLTSLGVTEWASLWTMECSGARERSERCKRTSERKSRWPSAYIWILDHSIRKHGRCVFPLSKSAKSQLRGFITVHTWARSLLWPSNKMKDDLGQIFERWDEDDRLAQNQKIKIRWKMIIFSNKIGYLSMNFFLYLAKSAPMLGNE